MTKRLELAFCEETVESAGAATALEGGADEAEVDAEDGLLEDEGGEGLLDWMTSTAIAFVEELGAALLDGGCAAGVTIGSDSMDGDATIS